MRRTSILLSMLLLLLVAAGCQPVQGPAASDATEAAAEATTEATTEELAAEDAPAGDPLPFDPDVRTGTLPNGLTYYIRHNAEPPQRAEVWLAVNAGSVLEDEDQKGLAHFLEHMLFNGTENFAGMELVNFLESIGMQFGPDVNAYTSFDETVYTLQAPTDDDETLARAFDVLAEWASRATISPDEVEAERGVIVEEWRMRDLNASGRVNDELIDTLLAGSLYAERLPIGDMEIVRGAPADTLRRYYETWYRPDNMAVIAVGDFGDLDQVQAWIEERFGGLENPAAALDRPEHDVPDYAETGAAVITDPEFPATIAYVAYRQEAAPLRTTADYRDMLADMLAADMLNQRFTEITRRADADFLGASTGTSELVRPVQISTLFVQTEEDGILAGLEAALTEVERARQHGFTEAEFERARTELLRLFESTYAERNNIENRAFAEGYLQNFLTGAIPTAVVDDYALAQELLPAMTLAEVNARVPVLYPEENRAVLLVAPEKEGVTLPDEETLTGLLTSVAAAPLEQIAEAQTAAALLDTLPEPVELIDESELDELGITRLELANGMELWLKPSDFKDDEVLFNVFSPGGLSLVEDADVVAASLAPLIVSQSGVGEFSLTDLDRLLAGKEVSLSPYLDELEEGFSGSASPQDLETLFQLLYLYATQPRADGEAFTNFQRQVEDYLANRALAPESALEDRYNDLFCGDDPRCNVISIYEQTGDIELARALELYGERLGDLDDATILMAGAFDVETVKQLAQTYLGPLSTGAEAEEWRNLRPPLPSGAVTATVNAGIDPSSQVRMYFTGPFTPTLENRIALQMMTRVLDIMVREDLREARGGIYGAGIGSSIEALPAGQYQTRIQFTAEPTRVVELNDAVFAQIKDLRDNGPSAANFAKAQEQMRLDQEENLQDNAAWLTWMDRYLAGVEGSLDEILRIEDVIDAVTPEDVQAMAAAVLPDDEHVTLILHPKDFQAE
jgi:zinc protease